MPHNPQPSPTDPPAWRPATSSSGSGDEGTSGQDRGSAGVRETVERLREQITCLTEQLAAAEDTLNRLEITRATIRELATEDGDPQPDPLPPGCREILALFEQAEKGLRAKHVCRVLGLGTEPRHTENTRAKKTPGQPRRPR